MHTGKLRLDVVEYCWNTAEFTNLSSITKPLCTASAEVWLETESPGSLHYPGHPELIILTKQGNTIDEVTDSVIGSLSGLSSRTELCEA